MASENSALLSQIIELASQANAGGGRPLEELLNSNDPLKGVESQRLRNYFTSESMEPGRDLDEYGRAIFMGDLGSVQKDFSERVSKHLKTQSEEAAREAASAELFALRWGPTRVPIFDLLLLATLIVPTERAQQLDIARWLIQQAKVPVDGTDLSGSTALYHTISTKPAFDPEYAEILHGAGADVNSRNRYGGTAAHEICLIWEPRNRAVVQRAADALEWYLRHGGNIDIKDNDGPTVRGAISKLVLSGIRMTTWDVVMREDERRKKLGDRCCTFCGREPQGETRLLTCSRCRSARYCAPSRPCQKADWPHHGKSCKQHRKN
ncbi:hypothetical protein B0H21DRAFT_733158 [Amylocystis lapponica]|nr:hypothetical protein B0H21DRAFT_733158 [Amylocystis lapponica]